MSDDTEALAAQVERLLARVDELESRAALRRPGERLLYRF